MYELSICRWRLSVAVNLAHQLTGESVISDNDISPRRLLEFGDVEPTNHQFDITPAHQLK